MTPNRIHDALPWFVNGTLEPEEAATFERHLMDCADCKRELEFLEKLKAQIERHGDDFLADHPSPEKLVSLLEPAAGDEDLAEEEITRLRRHLALCATCAEEARWLRGEATAGSPRAVASDSTSSVRTWRWVAVAALVLLAATVTLWIRQSNTGMGPGSIRYTLLEETTRAASEPVEATVPHGSSEVYLAFEVDFDADAFPLALEISGKNGKPRYARKIRTEDLNHGYSLLIGVPRRILPDGEYRARLTGSRGGAGVEYPFRVVGQPRP